MRSRQRSRQTGDCTGPLEALRREDFCLHFKGNGKKIKGFLGKAGP